MPANTLTGLAQEVIAETHLFIQDAARSDLGSQFLAEVAVSLREAAGAVKRARATLRRRQQERTERGGRPWPAA